MKNVVSRRRFLQLGATTLAGAGSALWLPGCSDGKDNTAGLSQFCLNNPLPQDAQGRWWLSNNYAPVFEERDEMNLKVVGDLPRALSGLYARIGSNMADTEHWFLGHGMFHGVRLEEGRALWYRNRYIHTALREAGTDELTPTDPVSSYSNVAPIYHAGRLFTMGEIGLPYETNPADLSTVGVYNFNGALGGSMTAHPKIDPLTGDMLFFGYDFRPPFLTYYRATAAGELVEAKPITLPASVMMHDFAITQRYVIFYDLPIAFNFNMAAAGSRFPFSWDFDHVPRMGVMPRDGGDQDIQWFEVSPNFVFHTMNAFDNPADGNEIILHVARINGPFWGESNLDFSEIGFLTEYRFDLAAGTVSENIISDIPQDFGQVNRSLWGQPYRYGYGMDFSVRGEGTALARPVGIVRHDHQTGNSESMQPGDHLSLEEAIFVADPESSGEQDGWLMCYAYNANRCASELLIFDARDFGAAPVARVELPARVPHGFHGVWVPDAT